VILSTFIHHCVELHVVVLMLILIWI